MKTKQVSNKKQKNETKQSFFEKHKTKLNFSQAKKKNKTCTPNVAVDH